MSDDTRDEAAKAHRGRPRVNEPGSSVSTWLKPSEHDKLIKLAKNRDTSVSSLVRDLIVLRLS